MKTSTSVVFALCLVELACSSDGAKREEKKPDAAGEGTGGKPSGEKEAGPVVGSGGKSSIADAVAPTDAGPGVSADICATDLVCVSPTGVYVCENAGPQLVP